MKRKLSSNFLPYPLIAWLLIGCQAQTQAPKGIVPNATADARIVAVAHGIVESEYGLLNLIANPAAAANAKVSAVLVHEGDQVRAGQVLVQLSDLNGKQAQVLVQAKLARAKLVAEQTTRAIAPARQRALRLLNVAKAGAGTGQAADDAQAVLAELVAQLGLANADVALAQAELDQLKLAEQELTLRAPAAGLIIDQNARLGAGLGNSPDALVVLLPDGPRRIRVQISEDDIANVKVGMRASVQTPGDTSAASATTLDAKVRWIAPIFRPTRAIAAQADTGLQHVDCLLDIDAQSLRIGTQVTVRIAAN